MERLSEVDIGFSLHFRKVQDDVSFFLCRKRQTAPKKSDDGNERRNRKKKKEIYP
jgi:hypothetical protein